MRLTWFVVCVVVLAACSSGGSNILQTDTGTPGEEASVADRGTEAFDEVESPPMEVAAEPDEGPDLVFEVSVETTPEGCNPGDGCFGDKCTENSQCQSGWCVEHMGEGVCSQLCSDECPMGWSCDQVQGTGPDLVYVCVSGFANLCRPCAVGADCKSGTGAEGVCLDYGEEGSFCGGKCVVSQDCPWGFSCKETLTVEGVLLKQCVADTGTCPCTGKWAELGLSTPCMVTNEAGTCTGQRICKAEGLSPCDAATPEQETCNGADDNCSGEADEPILGPTGYLDLCDDGNECTVDACNGSDGCDHQQIEGGECKDGDPCTVGDHCEAGVCSGLPVACDDGNPCTDDLCDQLGGCKPVPNTADCNDGDPCTVKDTCSLSVCSGFAIDCGCTKDADCAPLEDGDLCNGTLFCDTSKLPYQCAVKEDSIVSCPAPSGADAVCKKVVCAAATGECETLPANDGFACTDGDACTIGDQCTEGECTPGVPLFCADNNPCTDGSCDPASGCAFTNNSADCFDGNLCTVDDECSGGKCSGGPLQLCDDGNLCTDDSCDPGSGCKFVANSKPCDDGNACTTGDQCSNGKCTFLASPDCNDGDICTNDYCSPATGCVHTLNSAPCDDGDVCTTGDHCVLGQCKASGSFTCTDNNPCTNDVCDPKTGCAFPPNSSPCDDGTVCTVDDLCKGGKCVPGAPLSCDDSNSCTADSCDPVLDCQHVPVPGDCDDGNECTTEDQCQAGQCAGGPPLECVDGNPCTKDGCDAALGCSFVADNSAACSDGNACTTGDYCQGGQCKNTGSLPCDDGNECTADSCLPASGCAFSPVADSTPCNGGGLWKCIAGKCEQTSPHGSQTFTYTGGAQTFNVPVGISTVTVVVVGGGGGGAGSHYGGGGSGHVRMTACNVADVPSVSVTVGAEGAGGISGTNDAPGSHGQQSSFGVCLSSPGGNGGHTNGEGGGDGGSGGGGAGNSGCAGAGGSGGAAGQGGCTYPGGAGGHFDNLSGLTQHNLTAGSGGAAGQSSHSGGGGAGGVLVDGAGPTATNGGQSWSGKGGVGYGAGGGAGGYWNGERPTGGTGAHGLIYVEW